MYAKLSKSTEIFKCLQLAFDVMEIGGTAPCVLNAANEIAVEQFLENKISFNAIPELIKDALDNIEIKSVVDLETIVECDSLTREYFNF